MLQPPADVASSLRELTALAAWPDDMLLPIANLAQPVACRGGQVVFRQGEQAESIYFILGGRVALEMSAPARAAARLLTLSRGDLLGWSPLVGGREMTATAVALEDSQLLQISAAALQDLCRQNQAVGYAVMQLAAQALSRRLTATRLQLLDLYAAAAPENVASRAAQP